MKYSPLEKHREALHEVAQRKRVYNRLIDAGRMTREDADRKIALMEEIAADYFEQVEMEKLL